MTTWDKVRAALSAHNLRHERGDMWRSNSPYRPDSDSMAFHLNISDGEHGVWYDHAAGENGSPVKGTLYDLAKHMGIDLPHLNPAEESKRHYSGLAEYAKIKGVPESAFTDMWWKPETVTVVKRPALEFPTQGGARWRFIDGHKPYFSSVSGYKRCWYGLQRAISIANATKTPLLFCNGEPSVVVGQHFGLPATTITSGEKGQYPPELITQLKDVYGGEIIVALDSDYKGSSSALKFKAQLEGFGFKVRTVDLGLGDKGDIADFCKLHQGDSLKTIQTLPELAAPKEAQLTLPANPAGVKVDYCSDIDSLKIYMDEINGDVMPAVPPMIMPYTFLHQYGGLAHIIPAGKLVYFCSVSGGTKTISFETGIEANQEKGIHNILYSPEWIDDKGAVEMASRSVQRAGGASVQAAMLNALYQQEQSFRLRTQAGVALSPRAITHSLATAGQLMQRPGRVFYIKQPGLSTERLCAQIEAIYDIEAANGNLVRAVWVDFAQLLWLERPDSSGRLWIETAISLLKDTCRRKNLVGFVSSQMRKDDAELAKNGGKLSGNMMQWLSDQQANFIMTFVPEMDETGRPRLTISESHPEHKVMRLRSKIIKNSLAALPDEEFFIPVDFNRLTWMQPKVTES